MKKADKESVTAISMRRTMKNKNWIAGAIKKPGALHRQLGVKKGNKIPGAMLEAAAKKKGTKEAKRARLALTLRGLKHKKTSIKCKSCGK